MTARRKSGTLPPRRRNARKLRRDVEIYRILRRLRARGLGWHGNLKVPVEALSVYMRISGPKAKFNNVLAPFPKREQENGRAMPHWDDLTLWLKVQLAIMLMDEWTFQTFSIQFTPTWKRSGPRSVGTSGQRSAIVYAKSWRQSDSALSTSSWLRAGAS